ncbi:Tpr-related protein family member, putative [Theileria annulata]|uniref:Tpr-related protein family member, putative n=1 Tax=Theileria annulata TaxID=5874 RepID=Q4UIL3_THEAN|nr:Tpr-related protein family member, putative [Theileria annulata]CAI73076.1 Tpr-related protein family member, putative [Theileria annulata]|eukprot:XP_953754.1 Tpr-related protein family member, putative [Theileria annulata]
MSEDLKKSAYIFAGLGMMLNIRLAYSSAPYALIRFRLPENLFSVFVRRMASALELWCLPGFVIVNLMDQLRIHAYSGKTEKDWGYNWQSIIVQWLNCLTFVILLYAYRGGGDTGHLTGYYFVIAVSGFVFGLSNPLVYAVDWQYIPVYMAGENSFPMVTSLIHYITTLIFGNRRKWNSDFLIVMIDISVAIIISFVGAILWTVAFYDYTPPPGGTVNPYWQIVSPIAMVIVGMGLVYAIYPGIAPGMIVPFYLIDKIEMVLLIATAVPPVIVAILREHAKPWSPQHYVWHGQNNSKNGFYGWTTYEGLGPTHGAGQTCSDHVDVYGWIWHFFDILIPLKIALAIIFIYSLHYRDSKISRSIVNQPKMSTALSIVFYMCHEILLALGFPGIIGNNGATYVVLPAQYVGAFLMVFLAFYSEGYIIEYKSHDPDHWPTDGMWYIYGY